jgi:hypothetical protein
MNLVQFQPFLEWTDRSVLYTEPRWLINVLMVFCALAAIFLVVLTGPGHSTAYRYRKDGIWHVADHPGETPASQLTESVDLPQEVHAQI